ncbi:MAG: arginase family protein [Chloroflexia bacterium]|nr:arginase family protein [Chloroflexia bacterium]
MSEQGRPRLTVVDAPSNLGLRPSRPGKEPGVRRLAEALRANGLVERLQARDGGRVMPAAYSFALDPAIGVRNWRGARDFALDLAGHLRPLLDRGLVPIVLGGDCSILLGPMLAPRERGTYGLVFIDGHDDLLVPKTSQTGGAAGMDLALLLGHGPTALGNLGGAGPLAQPENVAMLGMRNEWSAGPVMADLVANRIGLARSLAQLRQGGASAATAQALAVVANRNLNGFWIHLDADVLDNALMPAVDSPQPGGLSYDELIAIVGRLVAAGGVAGMTVTIDDPDLDPTGAIGAAFTDALVRALGPA